MIGAVLNDRYRLDAELGRGGMGIVYQARDLLLDRDVAAKVLSGSLLGTEGRSRLLREARSAARLNHPNIVSVYDAGEATLPGIQDPVPFIIMERVAGPSLHERPPDTLEEALRLAAQICAALEHAHAHGIVHRDLKPENVLLAPGDPGGKATAKLNDFGLARSMVSRLTTEGTVMGTVFYLAPELALGQAYDGRADLYALGVMLYELATGELPFTAADSLSVISQHLHAPPVPPRARNEALPAALDALILRLLSKSPEDRPRSAGEVSEALARLASGETPPATMTAEGLEISILDRIARGRLVAREEELARMRALWQRAAAGEGQVLLVSGEPGVGKSRLVRELVTQVQVAGDRAVVGECYAESGTPYAPFGQIVRRALQNGGDELKLPDFVLAELVALAPTLRLTFPDVPPSPALDPQSEQQRLFESVVALCVALCARGPLLVVLEDGHWADSGSLALLHTLARRTRRQPVLIAVTYREVELDETRPFRDLLVDLNRERLASRLKLSRLDREGTRQLLAALFATEITTEFRDGIYRETEGNPFFVEEVCKALVENGSVTFADGDWHRPPNMDEMDIPQSLRLAIQSRVGRLPERAQQTLQMAAILGREFSVDILAEAMDRVGVDEEAVIEALETATRAQLVEEAGGTRELLFAFVHALVAATLAEEVPTLRRRRLHRYAAEAVERLHPEDDEALAHHYAAAGDEERALTYSTRAGDRAAVAYANAEAERHYRTALELVEDGPARAGLLGKLGVTQARQSRFEEALASWRRGIELYAAAGDRDGVACLYAYAGRTTWDRGDTAGGLDMCREGMAAVARMDDGPAASVGMARLLHETARACYFNGLPEEAASLGRQALELAQRLGAVELQAEALTTLAMLPGQTPLEAVALLRRAVELSDAAGLLCQAARAENNLGFTLLARLGDLDAARGRFLRASELNRQIGSVVDELFTRCNATRVVLLQGMLVTAEQELLALRQLQAAASDPSYAAFPLSFAEAELLRYRGRLTEAAARLQTLRAEVAAAGDLQFLVGVTQDLADIAFETAVERQVEEAADQAIRASEQLGEATIGPISQLCAWYAGRGEIKQARSLLSPAREEAAAGQSSPWDAAWLSRAEAHLAAAEGRWPEALAAFQSLAAELQSMGVHWWRASILREWAEALLKRDEPGDREQALTLLSQTVAEFEACGAPYYADRAKRRMQELTQD